jgi:hypothetical protein
MTMQQSTKSAANWCCAAFKGRYDAAGERDLAIIVDQLSGDYVFILQHRALEPGDPGPKGHSSPITIVGEIQINFCPWCGQRLAAFYGARVTEMVRPDFAIRRP